MGRPKIFVFYAEIYPDLKPANILVSGVDIDDPVVKLGDLGLSWWRPVAGIQNKMLTGFQFAPMGLKVIRNHMPCELPRSIKVSDLGTGRNSFLLAVSECYGHAGEQV